MSFNEPSWPPPGQGGPTEPLQQQPTVSVGPGGGFEPPGVAHTTTPTPTPQTPQRPPQRQRLLVIGVLGGLFALGMLIGGAILLTGGDDGPEPGDDTASTDDTTGSTNLAGPELAPDDGRIGTTVRGIGLMTGDCINYRDSGNITDFDIVACDTPHIAEITATMEHPAAGGDYPGIDEIERWAVDRCLNFDIDFIGADVLDTTLLDSALLPDFNDWAEGNYRVNCTITALDGGDLTESVENKGAEYARGDVVLVTRLKPGDCYNPDGIASALDLGALDPVLLTDCGPNSQGRFFGRGVLSGNRGEPYPGTEAIQTESLEICDGEFARFFGLPADGFNYNYWSPDEPSWRIDDRVVLCSVIDADGLEGDLDYSAYVPLADASIGTCFVFAPEETNEFQLIDDQVDPVDCDETFNGQVFGRGSLPSTDATYPGEDEASALVATECSSAFSSYIGGDAAQYTEAEVLYWYPGEVDWNDEGDLRFVCAVMSETGLTGSRQSTGA